MDISCNTDRTVKSDKDFSLTGKQAGEDSSALRTIAVTAMRAGITGDFNPHAAVLALCRTQCMWPYGV